MHRPAPPSAARSSGRPCASRGCLIRVRRACGQVPVVPEERGYPCGARELTRPSHNGQMLLGSEGFGWDDLIDDQRRPLVWVLAGFVVTAFVTRMVTRSIRRRALRPASETAGSRPRVFRNIHLGGVHIHHQVWGIAAVLVVGLLLVTYQPSGTALNVLALVFGCGAALALDEFAMWLHVEDVYWAREGRASISALLTAAAICTVLLMGTAPLGIGGEPDGGDGSAVVAVSIIVNLAFVVASVLKGKIPSALVGVFMPPVAVVAALRLAKPDSWWFRRYYAPDSGKRTRALSRFDAAYVERWRRLHDLVGGAPTQEIGTPRIPGGTPPTPSSEGSRPAVVAAPADEGPGPREHLAPRPNRDIEKWFSRRGLTLLLRGTGVGGGTSNKSAAPLVAIFLVVMLVLVPDSTSAPLWQAASISAVVLLFAWAGGNVARRRPPFAAVSHIGAFEAVAFVVGPMIAVGIAPHSPETFDGLPFSSNEIRLFAVLVLGLLQAVVLTAVMTAVMFGLPSLSWWLTRELLRSLGASGSALAATMPVILGVVFFFFLNPGVWFSIGRLSGPPYVATSALLLVLAAAFLGSRGQFDLPRLRRFDDATELREVLAGTPLAGTPLADPQALAAVPGSCPLSPRQVANARIVAVMSRLTLALVIGAGVFAFFCLLGFVAIDAETITAWTKLEPRPLVSMATDSRTYVLALEHVRVAGFLAIFAAFNYSLASATDARLRDGASGAAAATIRQACAMRLVLLRSGEAVPGTSVTRPTAR